MEQENKLKEFLLQEADVDAINKKYKTFFATVGEFFDSMDNENVSDDTHDLLDDLVDAIIDTIISCGDEDFDSNTEKKFLKIVDMLDLDKDISEGLAVKSRKVSSGRKRSQSSRMTGSDKLKYLKKLKKSRKSYKKNASLRRKTKKRMKRYKKTGHAKQVKRKYKALNRNK